MPEPGTVLPSMVLGVPTMFTEGAGVQDGKGGKNMEEEALKIENITNTSYLLQ